MNEAVISNTLQVVKGNLSYSSRPSNFRADVSGTKGPTPGAVSIATTGTVIDLSELTQPGLCRISNLDETNYCTYGVYDADTGEFYPLGELLAGEFYVLRFSRDFGYPWSGSATTTSLKFYANAAEVVVLVEAFEV
jgi:hypothetical protein